VFGVAPVIVQRAHYMWPTSRAKRLPDLQKQQQHIDIVYIVFPVTSPYVKIIYSSPMFGQQKCAWRRNALILNHNGSIDEV